MATFFHDYWYVIQILGLSDVEATHGFQDLFGAEYDLGQLKQNGRNYVYGKIIRWRKSRVY